MAKRTSPHGYLLLDGDGFRLLVEAGTRCVEQYAEAINALNVFPVPDGDTGTNMLLTMQAAASSPELPERGTGTVAEVSRAIARGALLGARGNSGVIFSQFLKGLASALAGCAECDGGAMRGALAVASDAAYQSVGVPVEGTMLSVIRAAAQAVESSTAPLPAIWDAAYQAAEVALARTPEQLPVLKEAGVVDAGGQGVVAFMAGARAFLSHQQPAPLKIAVPAGVQGEHGAEVSFQFLQHTQEDIYGYCTQFVVRGQGLDLEALRAEVAAMATSTVVVGDETIARVHAHLVDPGSLLTLGTSLGVVEQVKIENMDTMHQEFMASHGYTPRRVPVGVIAVASGEGLERVFRELGAVAVVRGGQTMNPSAGELVEAVSRAQAEHVLLLPNNPNIFMAARQAIEHADRPCTLVPSTTIPQGVAALLAFNPDLEPEANAQAMAGAIERVRTGEVTTAVRDSAPDGVSVRQGQAIALLDGKVVAVAASPNEVLVALLRLAGLSDGALVTLYWGGSTDQASGIAAAEDVRRRWPGVEVELVPGGQPHYHYLVSIE